MITQVDDQIGRLVAHLKKTGEYDQTLIVFTCHLTFLLSMRFPTTG